MSMQTANPPADAPPCPDPSAHEKDHHLSAAASTAALYATHPERNTGNPLGSDGKLSSRSAATSLKYAQPQDLPSFPSRGADFSAANTAAMLAKDHKMKDLWQPETSVAGSKAALLAHKDGGKVDLWQHSPSSAGHSAATIAMRNKNLSPQLDRGGTDVGRNNSLLAATKSHNMGRQRAGSMPTAQPANYPDSRNSGRNALNAAAASHRASIRSPDGWNSDANQAARLKNAHMDRQLFTEDPQIQTQADIDEQRHQAALHASAASFAKSIYTVQKRGEVDPETSSLHDDDPGVAGASSAHRRNQSAVSQTNIREEAIKYIHLQDAAHKLAQERLAKVDKDMEHGRYREYYGYPNKSPRKSQMSRLSMRGGRKRASSEGQVDSDDEDDELQARRIRQQMSQLSTGINNVGDQQRQDDRARLLAAAEKRVHAQMHDMDEKVFMDTGKPTQAMMDDWEIKARAKAERDRADRDRNPGKTHIGGGKYMDDADIQAIAAARLKPTLDELNDTAEKKRARDEEMRAKRDAEETARMNEKMKSGQQKAEFKRIKEQDKAAARREKDERKAAQRAEKDETRARKSEDQRKSREQTRGEVAAVAGGATLGEVADNETETTNEPKTRDVAAAKPDTKEKSGRGMFDRIANRLKKHGDDRKTADEERPAASTFQAEQDNHDGGAAVAGVAALGVGAGAVAATGLSEDAGDEKDVRDTGMETQNPRGIFAESGPSRQLEPDRAVVHSSETEMYHDAAAAPIVAPVPVAATTGTAEHFEDSVTPNAERDEDFADDDQEAIAGVAALPGAAPLGTGAEAPSGDISGQQLNRDELRDNTVANSGVTRDLDELDTDSEDDNELSDRGKGVAATAGIAALGGIIAAGALGAEHRRKQEEEEQRDEVSSLDSTDSDEPQRPGLHTVASAEHTGDYTFAAPSTGLAPRPDLERHISTIQDSSDEADDESDFPDSDSEDEDRGRGLVTHAVDQAPPGMVERSEETPDRDRSFVVSPTPAPRTDAAPFVREAPAPVIAPQEKPGASDPVLSEIPREQDGNFVFEDIKTVPDSEPAKVEQRAAAPAPVIKAGPSAVEEDKPQEKESKGLRGFFSKLKNKSKTDNKLQKDPPASESRQRSTTTPVAPAAPVAAISKTDDTITPVTTTTAGREAEHVGTDGPIGDPKHISGIGGDPRAVSPSSFKRNDQEGRDLDDVSSSGADEDDYARGRGGRLAQRLGLAKGEGKREEELEPSTSNGDDDQFEEARDHFDESLAPPPAFAGQAKSESPNRATKFQEQL